MRNGQPANFLAGRKRNGTSRVLQKASAKELVAEKGVNYKFFKKMNISSSLFYNNFILIATISIKLNLNYLMQVFNSITMYFQLFRGVVGTERYSTKLL